MRSKKEGVETVREECQGGRVLHPHAAGSLGCYLSLSANRHIIKYPAAVHRARVADAAICGLGMKLGSFETE